MYYGTILRTLAYCSLTILRTLSYISLKEISFLSTIPTHTAKTKCQSLRLTANICKYINVEGTL